MTIVSLTLIIGLVALVLTVLTGMVFKKVQSWALSFLQNFTGALFVFSGFVKAIDPLGTAFKMEQYFTEFELTFQDTWMSFLSPLFPILSEFAPSFSVIMIVFEIVLGLMLLVGSLRKFTAWAFLLLVAFFTVLTGFTYLTGYVPADVNFFEFGKWGPYTATNMKVTDCGCFGDFLKLEPRVSFLKDVFLLVPAILFVLFSQKMHQLFALPVRASLIGLSAMVFTWYCFSNYVWDIPGIDFRPFKVGVNILEQKNREIDAENNVEITGINLTNKETGEVISNMSYGDFMANFKDYPKENWDFEYIKSAPTVARTKISDFDVSSSDGQEVTEEILSDPNYSFMIIAYKLYGDVATSSQMVKDTSYRNDTLLVGDEIQVSQIIDQIADKQVTLTEYNWDPVYVGKWKEVINPVLASARDNNLDVFAITGYANPDVLESFKAASGSDYTFHVADDILLKTIVRSNPGVVLLKNGTIVQKWHYKQLPTFEEIRQRYMNE
ncbi:MAG: DoxX family protein [Saprospiraceae bacterium]|jgi:uncharacterized membrane protein YphA (DoxX/SURF4 family)|nr:DoxX family protein [Saprospiraceae bacterium]MDP4997566.1 DoxX family protein [Saprospiraceae bacterium]